MSLPESIGRYRVARKLGEGGMGVVYAARDEVLDRPVAIKMIRESLAQPGAEERFFREARAAASVNHPNICQLYEIGEHAGAPFLAMELLEGEPLSARLERGPLPLPEAVQLTLSILSALEALHRRGLVHRDLKPSNIFLTAHGLKLLDFGLAKPAATADQTHSGLTLAGAVVGTPAYMAPEVLRGEPADSRSDLFAVGVILYELLIGKRPFNGNAPLEIMHAILYDEPSILTGAPAINAVDRVLRRALVKRREARYSQASDMAHDLRAALLLVGSGSVPQVQTMTRLLVLPFRLLRPDPEVEFLSFSLPDAIAASLSGLDSVVVRSSMVATGYANDAPDLKAIASEADVNVVIAGSLLRAAHQLRVNCQMLQAPEGTILCSSTSQVELDEIFQLQDDLARRIVEALSTRLGAGQGRGIKRDIPVSAQAYEFYLRANQLAHDMQNLPLARELYLKSLEADPNFAPAWAHLGRLYRFLSKFSLDDVEENLTRAQQAFQRAIEINPALSVAQNFLAHVETEQGRAPEAMTRLLGRAAEQTNDPELFASLVHVCRYCGLLEASLAAHEQARRLDRTVRTSVMHTYWMMGNYQRALEEGGTEVLGYLPAVSLVALGRESEALALMRDRELQTPDRRRIAYVASLRALLEGQREESLRLMQEVITAGFRDPEGIYYLARQHAFLGEPQRALELLERVVEGGYYCFSAMARDPWLDSLRAQPAFTRVLETCEQRLQAARAEFLKCSGERVLQTRVAA